MDTLSQTRTVTEALKMVTAIEVVPDTYSETVSIAKVPATQDDNLGLRLYVGPGPQHCRQAVFLNPCQVPVSYQDSLIVYIGSSKKRYVSRTFYDTKLRPTRFAETSIQRELMTEEFHISSVDHRTKNTRRWYKSAVTLTPKTFTNKVNLQVDKGTFKNTADLAGDLTDDLEATKVIGGVKVSSRDTRSGDKLKSRVQNDTKITSYRSGPLIVDTSERKGLNNNDELQEDHNKYVNGVNGNFYDDDDDDGDINDYIYNNDIYKTGQVNGWHGNEVNGYSGSHDFAFI